MRTRHQIGVAQGILMHTCDLTVDQPFALLGRYSNVTNTEVEAVASDIVRGNVPELPSAPDAW